jgi:hypothetical protein
MRPGKAPVAIRFLLLWLLALGLLLGARPTMVSEFSILERRWRVVPHVTASKLIVFSYIAGSSRKVLNPSGHWLHNHGHNVRYQSEPADKATQLYRYKAGQGSVYCSACHGSPHAECPTLEANDHLYSHSCRDAPARSPTIWCPHQRSHHRERPSARHA